MDGVMLRIAGVRIYYCVLSVRINGYTERQMGPLLVDPYQTCAAYEAASTFRSVYVDSG